MGFLFLLLNVFYKGKAKDCSSCWNSYGNPQHWTEIGREDGVGWGCFVSFFENRKEFG